ncbi:unnamed protein product [Ceratitis capitata]|uniref:(Mediterranean fruit fly) hypothetical protein n=1 Tax=Ceratitis capitata TaxID=7213 RepID=A0A811V1V7_CERCA|nr:unnamed protein product [Ceratitis capitata]
MEKQIEMRTKVLLQRAKPSPLSDDDLHFCLIYLGLFSWKLIASNSIEGNENRLPIPKSKRAIRNSKTLHVFHFQRRFQGFLYQATHFFFAKNGCYTEYLIRSLSFPLV